jgi:hypothetical protein
MKGSLGTGKSSMDGRFQFLRAAIPRAPEKKIISTSKPEQENTG